MTKELEKKLLAEAFDALVNDNDVAKATRLFRRQWDLKARNCYSLLESEDEDLGVTDMGDDFNNEIADDQVDELNDNCEQVLLAIDELEDKFPGEISDEVLAKLDDLRNVVDEIKLGDGEEDAASVDDALVIIEDLKNDYEMAGAEDEEISDLFDEISAKLQGDSDADVEEIDVADDDSDLDFGSEDEEKVDESEDIADELAADGEADVAAGEAEEAAADELADEEPVEAEGETVEVKEETYDDLMDILNRLESEVDEEPVEEGWSNIADPRKKMTSEEEGVNKKGTMNFGKLSGAKLDKKPRLGVASTDSKGESANKKAKVCSNENNGTKQWHKVEKPANKPAAGKSMMGK